MNDLSVVDDELRRMCDEFVLWSFGDQPAPAGTVVDVAGAFGRTASYVARRLRSAGYEVFDAASLTDEDRFLVSADLDSEAPWLSDSRAVRVWHLAGAAIKLDMNPHLIARRMLELGYELPAGWGLDGRRGGRRT